METAVGVALKKDGKIEYFNPNGYNLKENVTVIVETNQGLQFGKVVTLSNNINVKQLQKVIRISSKKDYQKHIKNLKEAQEALKKAKELVKQQNLNMNIIDATYTFDRDKLIFRFLSDNRVDFRNLAKELASIYKVRIELRQIGARDKAKEIGGYGPCGQKLCCARFLKELDAVSINMAKNQNIALNPSKINGSCGRLLCCLKYENENYTCAKKNMLKIGDKIKIENGEGTIIGLDILKQQYKVKTDSGSIIMVDKQNGSN